MPDPTCEVSDGICTVTTGKFEIRFRLNDKGGVEYLDKSNLEGGRGPVVIPEALFQQAKSLATQALLPENPQEETLLKDDPEVIAGAHAHAAWIEPRLSENDK